MEKIIIKQANYPIIERILKRKIILYNNEQKMLILVDGKFIKLPKKTSFADKKVEYGIEQIVPIPLEITKIEELVTIINYYNRFIGSNNKLKKVCRELINEYYIYNIEFNQEIIDLIVYDEKFASLSLLPDIISMQDFIQLGTGIIRREDKEAVKILQKKLISKGE